MRVCMCVHKRADVRILRPVLKSTPSIPPPGYQMNKDEAEKCLELGRKFLRAGDHAKAIKFLDKSLRLYPLPGVAELKARAEMEQAGGKQRGSDNGGGSAGGSSSSSGNGEARRRHAPGAGGALAGGGRGSGSSSSSTPVATGACYVCLFVRGLWGRHRLIGIGPSK